MVVKKYLCNAPKKESWEIKAEALLTSLDGDEMKREQVARQTLSILKEQRKHEKKRIGPGRKSNAEHAMEFYEYILSLGDNNTEDEEKNIPFEEEKQQQPQQNNDNDNDNERATRTNTTSDDEEDGSSSTSNQSSSSSSPSSSSSNKASDSGNDNSIDTQEFLNQHDDACDVCDMGGELICCPTCSLVFHRECLRPQISKAVGELSTDWSCPHCIIQGIRGYKRHSKTWKRAETGARQMKRMKQNNVEKEQKSQSAATAKADQICKEGKEGNLVRKEGKKEVVIINSTSQNDTKTSTSTSASPITTVTVTAVNATVTTTTTTTTTTTANPNTTNKSEEKKNTSEEKKKEDGSRKMENITEEMKSSDEVVAPTTTTKNVESESSRSSKNNNEKEEKYKNGEGKQQNSHNNMATTTTTTTTPVAREATTTTSKEYDSSLLIVDDAFATTPSSSSDNNKNVNANANVNVNTATPTPTKKKRKNLALYKIADSYTPHCTESQLVIGRRPRKQPALYQPQLCADSRWQSSTTTPCEEKQIQKQIDDGGDNKIEGNNDDDAAAAADADDDDDDDDDYQDNDNDNNKNEKETLPTIEKDNNKVDDFETTCKGQVDDRNNVHKKEDDKDNNLIQQQGKKVQEEEEKVIICAGGGARAVAAGDEKKSAFGTPPTTTTTTSTSTTKIWCNFCHDNPEIGICVFCGCRRCFGKHYKTSLLLCDNCDEEYHTHCLGLKTVPLTQRWYCPNCEKKKTTDLVDSPRKSRIVNSTYANTAGTTTGTTNKSAADSSVVARNNSSSSKKNEPPASTTTTTTTTTKKSKTKTLANSEQLEVKATKPTTQKIKKQKNEAAEAEKKRPRGRPPKNKDILASTTTPIPRKRGPKVKSAAAATAIVPVKKKRGRPRKDVNLLSTMVVIPSQPPRKRGRPRKEKNINTESSVILGGKVVETSVKKRGPKPKPSTTTTTTASIDAINKDTLCVATMGYECPMILQELKPIKVSRISGRTVKRASFHDEIDEGEQHLRGFKYHHHQFGEGSQQTTTALKAASYEFQMMSEPSHKKQKIGKKKEDNSTTTIEMTTDNVPSGGGSEFKSTKSQSRGAIFKIHDKEDESVYYPPPVAPVRMKPVVQPPAPAIMWPPHISLPVEPPKLEGQTWTTSKEAKSFVNMTTTREQDSDLVPATASVGNDQLGTARKTKQPPSSLSTGTNQPVAAHVAAAKVIGGSINVYPELSSPSITHELPRSATTTISNYPSTSLLDPAALEAAVKALPVANNESAAGEKEGINTKCPRRKPGARECMQISRRFGVDIIPENQMTILLDYCRRGKVEHLIRMRERLDCHSRFLESQLAGLECLVKKVGESNIVVPALPDKRELAKSSRGVISSINIQSTTSPTTSDSVVNVHPTMATPIPVSSSATSSTIKMAPPTAPAVNDKKPAPIQN